MINTLSMTSYYFSQFTWRFSPPRQQTWSRTGSLSHGSSAGQFGEYGSPCYMYLSIYILYSAGIRRGQVCTCVTLQTVVCSCYLVQCHLAIVSLFFCICQWDSLTIFCIFTYKDKTHRSVTIMSLLQNIYTIKFEHHKFQRHI